jgi:uncharacterized membrane protein
VLLIQGFYAQHGIDLDPRSIAIWALPTAIAAFVIHSTRLYLYQRRLQKIAKSKEVDKKEMDTVANVAN